MGGGATWCATSEVVRVCAVIPNALIIKWKTKLTSKTMSRADKTRDCEMIYDDIISNYKERISDKSIMVHARMERAKGFARSDTCQLLIKSQ